MDGIIKMMKLTVYSQIIYACMKASTAAEYACSQSPLTVRIIFVIGSSEVRFPDRLSISSFQQIMQTANYDMVFNKSKGK